MQVTDLRPKAACPVLEFGALRQAAVDTAVSDQALKRADPALIMFIVEGGPRCTAARCANSIEEWPFTHELYRRIERLAMAEWASIADIVSGFAVVVTLILHWRPPTMAISTVRVSFDARRITIQNSNEFG